MSEQAELHGILGQFDDAGSLVAAAKQTHEAGYAQVDAYSPYPIEELPAAIGMHRTRLPLVVLIGAIAGGVLGYALQYYVSAIAYPLNVGGRPLHSWPSFVPVTFEMTILGGALSAVLGMLALNRLPHPHHPLFAVEAFTRASRDGFFLCVEAVDPQFDAATVRALFDRLGATEVIDVPR